ncbi:MAG: DUF502 domain-containing protein [Gammaproteobacteria bacterium]|jgi:uncharacterized membrane protein|nr:DUF502 domain-containing protein [Gammaproteobacteria bacterium]
MAKRFRTYLVTGLLVWVPLGITVFLIRFMVGFVDRVLVLIPPPYRPDILLGYHIPGLGFLLVFLVLLVTGLLAANFFGRKLVSLWESLLNRIPLVRSVYSASKTFAEVVLTDSAESFKDVLLIEYPRKGLYSICFQTSTDLGEVQHKTGEEVICVFVPTTPNPTSGVMVMVPRKDTIRLDMEIEEAVKMVVSLGVVVPKWPRSALPAAVRPAAKAKAANPPAVAKDKPQP